MDGIHDMGGMEGFGPVPYRPEPATTIDTRWEAFSAAALFALLRSGLTNIDAHRHRIERLDPTRYLPISYWGRWLAAVESAAVDQGITDETEIAERLVALGHEPSMSAEPPAMSPSTATESRDNPNSFLRSIDRPPRFAVGDVVTTASHPPHAGHHRLPRYCRGRSGVVARVHPAFTFPDTMAHGRGEHPCHVYAVAFDATELWGPGADPDQRCHLDLFEPYLRPTPPEEQPSP